MPRKTLKRLVHYTARLAVSGKPIQSKCKSKVSADRKTGCEEGSVIHRGNKRRVRKEQSSLHESAFRILANLGEQRGSWRDLRSDEVRGTASATATFASAPLWQHRNAEEVMEGAFGSRQASQNLEDNPMWRYAVMGKEQLSLSPESGDGNALKETTTPEGQSAMQEGASRAMESSSQQLAPAEKQAMEWFSSLHDNAPHFGKGQGPDLPQADLRSAISAYASLPSGR